MKKLEAIVLIIGETVAYGAIIWLSSERLISIMAILMIWTSAWYWLGKFKKQAMTQIDALARIINANERMNDMGSVCECDNCNCKGD